MRSSVLLALIAISGMSSPASAAGRKTYPMNVPASGVRTITFKVQEGDFVLRGSALSRQRSNRSAAPT